ncbi:MAG: AlpA family phage regulatory protein [Alphaproteobacteria bacterium]
MATRYLRYADLVERQIVRNRTTLSRWIKHYGFPPGVLLGPNTRAWPEEEAEAWLQARAAEGSPLDPRLIDEGRGDQLQAKHRERRHD